MGPNLIWGRGIMSEIDTRKLTGYRLLVEAGRRDISEVPEPYRTVLENEMRTKS